MARPLQPPLADEIEVSVFGPGYGEAIAIHVGEGEWILVDSCLNSKTRRPASLEYLDSIGVRPAAVKSVVASHWHDDHVRGLSQLVEYYSGAELCISSVFDDKESQAFLTAHGGPEVPLAGGTKELLLAVAVAAKAKANRIFYAKQRALVYERGPVRAYAFSPTDKAITESRLRFGRQVPKREDPITSATSLTPNLESIVMHIAIGGDAILLGSDLENHQVGWQSVVADRWCITQTKASAYKVAHHGSETAEHDEIWTGLLAPSPVTVLTPFVKGRVSLPKPEDRVRIKGRASASFISSGASRKPDMPAAIEKRLQTIAKNVTPINNGFGSVHLRKKIGSAVAWSVDLDGRAEAL